ncbi:MAG: hypothetical protein MUE53_05685 [Chitinophagales bacterium]|nr:hypothetical protein [Chitinophagales bacterium]
MNINLMSLFKIFFLLWISFTSSSLLSQDQDNNLEIEDGIRDNLEQFGTEIFAHQLDSMFLGKPNLKKESYNIVYILPIKASQFNGATLSYNKRESLAFWEGVAMSQKYINYTNSRFRIHIWDNEQNDSITTNIVNSLDLLDIDAVVMPFHTKQASIVAQYCKKKQIPVFMALNASDEIAKITPLYFKFAMAKPRYFMQYYNDLKRDEIYKYSYTLFLNNADTKADQMTLKNLKYYLNQDSTSGLSTFQPITYNFNSSIKSHLKADNVNMLIISKSNEKNLNYLFSSLKNDSSLSVSLRGTNNWLYYKSLLPLMSKYNAVVYSDYFLDRNDPRVEAISQEYIKITKDNVIPNVYKGFDVNLYICNLLEKYGKAFPLYIHEYEFKGLTNSIQMKPVYAPNGSIKLFENVKLNKIKAFSNGWEKIN